MHYLECQIDNSKHLFYLRISTLGYFIHLNICYQLILTQLALKDYF